MTIYRLVRSEYHDDLSGYGAFLYGGRWNSKGQYAVYAAEHISLAVLEIVVNYDRTTTTLLPSFHLVELAVPDNEIIEIDRSVLKNPGILIWITPGISATNSCSPGQTLY